jgi:hypothetical protein
LQLAEVPMLVLLYKSGSLPKINEGPVGASKAGKAQLSTAKYPRIVFAVTTNLQRVLRLEDLGTSGSGGNLRKASLEEDDLSPSVDVGTQLEKAGIQGLIFPSVVKGGDDNLIVFIANCNADALKIQNVDEFMQDARKMVSRRKS